MAIQSVIAARKAMALLVVTFLLCGVESLAQLQRPWVRGTGRRSYRSAYSSGPSYPSQTTSSRPSSSIDEHFLDDEDWMQNKKVRYWDVRLASRRPNRYSWTSKIVMANILAYAYQTINPNFTNWGVKLSDKILRGEELYRLITPVFLHGSIFHIFSNMVSLQRVGDLERLFGSGRYLVSYMVAGAAGNLLSAVQSPNPALGASGAVFGVMSAFVVFLSRHEWLLGSQGRSYSDTISSTLIFNLGLGFVNPMIDNWGHLGGAIGGAVMAYYFGPRLYLAELPDGGRTIVDKPVLRLPRPIESIPEKVSNRLRRITRRMQVWRYKSELPEKPWRPKDPSGNPPPHRRMSAPTRSIKPKDF